MRLQSVPEFDNQRMLLQHVLDDAALNALAAAVDQADLTEASFVRGVDVFRDDRRDVTRRELVQLHDDVTELYRRLGEEPDLA